jgi:hypothetical protein
MRWNSVAGTATTLRTGGSEIQILVRARNVSLQNAQTGCGANPAYYIMGTGVIYPGVKRRVKYSPYMPPWSRQIKFYPSLSL